MRLRFPAVPFALGLVLSVGHAWGAEAVTFLPEKNTCDSKAEPVALGTALWNGWGRDMGNSRYQPEPALRATDVAKLKLKWAFGFQGPALGYGQPTVVDGRVFITSAAGRAYSLDAKTGCSYWSVDIAPGSRSTVLIAELGQSKRAAMPRRVRRTLAHLDVMKAPAAAIFGDDSGTVYALDAQKGTVLWKTQIETHPFAHITASPVLQGDRVYVSVSSSEDAAAKTEGYACCTFRGSVAALDVTTGKLAWKSYTVLEEPKATRISANGVQEFAPAGAAISGPVTIDVKREVLYVATGASLTSVEQSLTDAVAAFGLNDGKLRWVKQLTRIGELSASGFLSAPVLRNLPTGKQAVLAGQKSGVLYALDPDRGGEILWQTRVGKGVGGGEEIKASGGIGYGVAADYRNAYVALSGALSDPANPSGSITALDLKSGIVRWQALYPQPNCSFTEAPCLHGGSQALSVIPGSAFSGSMDGHLRAFSTIDGKLQWDFDTAKAFPALNGIAAHGGPLDRGGATIVNGTVYITSGNALLAFSADAQ